MVKDLELKREILDKKIDALVRAIDWSFHKEDVWRKTGEVLETYGTDIPYKVACRIVGNMDKEILRVSDNLNCAYRRRKKRLENKISEMLKNNDCVFLTLTFSDKVLLSTTEETRRRYITRYLKSQYSDYVANIDFGKNNHREHYHALIIGKIDPKKYDLGNIDCKKVKNNNSVALAKYIAKITHHALKVSNKTQRVIYSR